MRLIQPIKGPLPYRPIGFATQYISQWFGQVWIADRDMVVNGVSFKKGDNVCKKAFNLDGHNGVDIVAPKGTPIYAAHSGYIIEADGTAAVGGFGIRTSLYFEANGFEWLLVHGHLDNYSPLPRIPWNWNNRAHFVIQGDKIGEVDSTGFSTGHHLHWGLYKYKNGIRQENNNGFQGAIDPWQFVKEQYMEIFQIEGEQTLVVKNMDGKFYYLATEPDLYPYVARILGIKDKNFTIIKKYEVELNIGGELKAGLTFVAK